MNIKNKLLEIYHFTGMPTASYGTLPYYGHRVLRKIKRAIFNRGKVQSKPMQNTDDVLPSFHKICESDSLRIAFWSGIGDTLWGFVLIPAILKKYGKKNFVAVSNIENGYDPRSRRVLPVLERFDFVHKAICENFQIKLEPPIDMNTGFIRYLPAGERKTKEYDYFLVVNPYLERGKSFDYIANELHLDSSLIDYNFFDRYAWLPGDFDEAARLKKVAPNGYCVIYTCGIMDNTLAGLNRGALWSMKEWLELGKKIHEASGIKCVLIGGGYDIAYTKGLQAYGGDDYHVIFINDVGTLELTSTFGVLKNAKFVIGLASGITIASTYMKVPTGIFWRPQNLSINVCDDKYGFSRGFAFSWVPPKSKKTNIYQAFWYGIDTPDSVFAKLVENGWMSKKREIHLPSLYEKSPKSNNAIMFKRYFSEIRIKRSKHDASMRGDADGSIGERCLELLFDSLKQIQYDKNVVMFFFDEPIADFPLTNRVITRTQEILPFAKTKVVTNGDDLSKKEFDRLVSSGLNFLDVCFLVDESMDGKFLINKLRDKFHRVGINCPAIHKENGDKYSASVTHWRTKFTVTAFLIKNSGILDARENGMKGHFFGCTYRYGFFRKYFFCP